MDRDDGEDPLPERLDGAGWLLISDVDGTLTGDSRALAEFLDVIDGRVRVVLSSSRPVDSVRSTLLSFPGAWMPAGIVGALGTEIELEGSQQRLWNQRFAKWDRRPVDEVMRSLGFEPHDDEYQTAAKASFSVPVEEREPAARALRDAGVEAAIFMSGASDFDIVAPGAGKAPAAEYVAERLGVAEDHVATAGDALIDVEMLAFGSGILVGNATTEARDAAAETVYRAEAPYAAGVLEGLHAVGALDQADAGRPVR